MAGLIPPSTLDQIRSASDIVDVVGGYVPLKRAGMNFLALCPFHKEKTPSFNVSPQRQIFHCFGCHKGGDVFRFVQEYENITFVEAVRRLAERARIPLQFDQNPDQQSRHLKESLWQIHEQITQRWHSALINDAAGEPARDYLRKRGVSDDAVKLFRIGYAPELWDDTVNWAKSKGHSLPIVEQAGLILRKEGSDHFYDRFRGRLIFPICDEQGRIVAFSGRLLAEDAKAAKYVNSPETPIFTKGRVFFGLDKSKRPLLDAETAIVCEGQLDLVACYMAGVQNVVAPQGTALTADHARILKRYVGEVVLCFDSDTAGQNAAIRSLDSLLAVGLAIRVAVIPAPHDPDSFIREHGVQAFRDLIRKAQGFFDFYLNRLCSEHDISTDKGRLAVVKGMGAAVQKTRSPVLVDTYAQKTALRLGVSTDAARAEFKTARSHTHSAAGEGEDVQASPVAERPSQPEFWLLKLLLLSDDHVGWLASHLDIAWIRHRIVRQVIEARLAAHAIQNWQGVATLLDDTDDAEARSLITEAAAEDRPIPNADRAMNEILLRLRNQFLDQQLAEIRHRIAQPELPPIDQERLLREQARIRQLKQQALEALNKTH